ncbi:MAG: protein kinase domain-containing protein [bacterium]
MTANQTDTARFQALLQQYAGLPLQEQMQRLYRESRNTPAIRPSFQHWLLDHELSGDEVDEDMLPEFMGFRLLVLLGRGSSSVVYLARQSTPRRLVALKLLHQQTDEVGKRRFIREAEYLAALHHPGIAGIYTAGEHQFANQPSHYIVMEYVDGVALNDFIASSPGSVQDRIKLLVKVGEALFHAHQRGIIHRDIKPENILVTADGLPHIVDFGIGQSLSGKADDQTRLTQHAQFVGTLAYMSPEQIKGQADTAGVQLDVYSLGMVAYEILAGKPAINISGLTIPQAIEKILDHKLEKLSSLNGSIDRDLDHVIARATAAEPDHRYLSVSEFNRDLGRWLRREPVLNSGLTTTYQLKQVIRRNKLAFSVVTAFMVAAMIGTVVASMFAIEESRARKIAEQQAERADLINQVLSGLLKSADPEQGKGNTLTVLQVVDNAKPTVTAVARERPVVGIDLNLTLADVLRSLGEREQAQQILDETNLLLITHPNEISQLRASVIQAALYRAEGKLDQAETILLANDGAAKSLPTDDLDRLIYLSELSAVQLKLGRPEAEQLLAQIFDNADPGDLQAREIQLVALHNLATLKRQTGDLPEARKLAEQVVTERGALYGEKHPMTLYSLNTLGSMYSQSGDHARAQDTYEQVLEYRIKIYGEDHLLTRNIQINLLNAMISQGKLQESDDYSQELLQSFSTSPSTSIDQKLMIHNMRAYLLEDMGQLEQAEHIYRETLAMLSQAGSDKFVQHYAIGNNLGMLMMKMGRNQEAASEFRKVLSDMEAQGSQSHYVYAITENNLGACLTHLGDYDSAKKHLTQSHAVLLSRFGESHRRVTQSLERQQMLQAATGSQGS